MALEVEEDVTVVRCRECGEPDRVGGVEFAIEQCGALDVGRRVEQLERRLSVGRVAGLDLEAGLTRERLPTSGIDVGDVVVEFGQRRDRGDAVLLEREAIGGADTGDVHERVGGAPLGVAHQLELAELAVIARLGPGVGVAGSVTVDQQRGQLAAQASPVRQHVGDPDRLGATRPELDAHPVGHPAGAGLDRLGVETQLQHVTRLGFLAGELGVDRLVGERAGVGVVDPAQEVGDAPDALVHERHLEHDVVAVGQHVADPVDPLLERLVGGPIPFGHLEHREPLGAIPVEDGGLVFEPLGQQHLRHLAERARLDGARARLDLVLQGEEVRAVEPRGDLRRGEEPFRHPPSVTETRPNATHTSRQLSATRSVPAGFRFPGRSAPRSCGRSVLDAEAAFRGGQLVGDGQPGHGGARRSLTTPGEQLFDPITGTLGHHLDRPVGSVAYPASYAEPLRLGPAAVAVEHTLHAARHDGANADVAHGYQSRNRSIQRSDGMSWVRIPNPWPPCE